MNDFVHIYVKEIKRPHLMEFHLKVELFIMEFLKEVS